jgi:hypothetical protein
MEITLPPEIEAALTERAQEQGTTPELLAADALRERFAPAVAEPACEGSLADYLRDYIGVFDSSEYVPGGARMSEDTGKKFAALMVEKRRRGHL